MGDVIIESRVIEKAPNKNKGITVRLNLKGIEKREPKSNEINGSTIVYRRTAGQFIYGKQNLHKGALGIIPNELDGYQSSSDLPAFNFKKGYFNMWFYYYFSRESYFRDLENISTGTGSKRINSKDLFQIKLKAPSYQEQKSIAEILSRADKELQLLERELSLLKTQKKGLMQLLLTGKVRVNEAG